MGALNDKQIWDEVFDGDVHTASGWTDALRKTHKETGASGTSSLEPVALYLEPSLNSNNGHQLTLTGCYTQLLTKLGYRTRVAHALKNSLQQKEDWLPYFLVGHHTRVSRDINSLSELEKVESYFLSEFEGLIEKHNPRVCIFATIRFTNIVAAAKALITNNTQHAVFGVMEAAEVPDCKDSSIVRSAFSRAARLLQESAVTHMFIAETDHVRTFLLDCGFREENVKVFPYVAAKLITDIPELSKKDSKNLQVGYLGGSRPVRHPELIADLLISDSLPDSVDLSVQLDLNYIHNKRGQNICDKINKMHKAGSITLYPPSLSDQQYRALFCSLDFIILPYGERYQQIGSGILLEAVYAGVIPLLPADSKMNELYTSLGGQAPSIKSLSTKAIRDSVIDGLVRYPTLKETVVTIREKWQQHPSSAEQWQYELTEWLPFHNV